MKAKQTKRDYYVEVTDTFAGEANYCWLRRYKVRAVSTLGAIQKLSHHTGLTLRKDFDTGDLARYDDKHSAVCAFVMPDVDPIAYTADTSYEEL